MSSSLNEVTLTADMLTHGNTLATMHIPKGHLAMMVKRGNQYLVPNGQLELQEGDTLLFISSNEHNPEA
jgi:cell volume regulation protein A